MTRRDMTAKRNGPDTPDAVALLTADHLAVEELFEDYETARGKTQKAKIAREICLELSLHTMIEEELLYPACRGAVDDNLLDEAYVEHDGAKMLIAELLAGAPDDEFYDAKVKVLSEMIKHHVREEEKPNGLFAQLKKTNIDLDDLGKRLAKRKQMFRNDFLQSGIPAPTTRSLIGGEVEHGLPLDPLPQTQN